MKKSSKKSKVSKLYASAYESIESVREPIYNGYGCDESDMASISEYLIWADNYDSDNDNDE